MPVPDSRSSAWDVILVTVAVLALLAVGLAAAVFAIGTPDDAAARVRAPTEGVDRSGVLP